MSSRISTGSSKHKQPLSETSALVLLVSHWSQKDVEDELHIFCSDSTVEPSWILEKVTTNVRLSDEENDYLKKVKGYFNFTIELTELVLSEAKAYYPATESNLDVKGVPLDDVIKDTIERSRKDPDRFVRSTIKEFMRAIQTLAEQFGEWRSQSSKRKIYEITFTNFIRDFAVLCCLKPECTLGTAGKTVWDNFKGLQQATATPDIRLMKSGLPEVFSFSPNEIKWPIVSIVKVKFPSDLMFMQKKDPVGKLSKRMEKLKPTAGDSSSEATSSDDSSFHPLHAPRKKKSSSNFIPINNAEKVFGQHAGELLFDLNKCLKETDKTVGRMPGMIIDGVKVILTLLEIQVTHLEKLRKNQKLDEDDKAVVYYSLPFDILNQRHRNILVEYFLKLNHMKGYGYT